MYTEFGEQKRVPWAWIAASAGVALLLTAGWFLFHSVTAWLFIVSAVEVAAAFGLIRTRRAEQSKSLIVLFGILCIPGFFMGLVNQKTSGVAAGTQTVMQKMNQRLIVPLSPTLHPMTINLVPADDPRRAYVVSNPSAPQAGRGYVGR